MTKEEEKAIQEDHKFFMDDEKHHGKNLIKLAIITYAACFAILASIFYVEIYF
jgi:hypothetical protein